MTFFATIVTVCSGISSITALCMLLIKPLREKLTGAKALQNGQRCLLRSDMLRTYYRHAGEKKIRQYEAENFELEYLAYKALGGNSFVDRVHEEVVKWEVLT